MRLDRLIYTTVDLSPLHTVIKFHFATLVVAETQYHLQMIPLYAFANPTSFKLRNTNRLPRHCTLQPTRLFKLTRATTSIITMATTNGGNKRILVAIGNGSEEIETSSAVDTFVRSGADVTLASVENSLTVTMSRGMKFVADTSIEDVSGPFDAVALPGGMPGAERLRDSVKLAEILKESKENGAIVAAVCASPAVVLASHGLLDGRKATCYPVDDFRGVLKDVEAGDVVVDGNVITGTGPGTSLKWALSVVEALYGEKKANELAGQLLVIRD